MLLQRLEPDDERPEFSCGDADLDEFYRLDSIEGGKQLLAVTYLLYDVEDEKNKCPANLVAFFCVSNDSIKKEEVPRSAFERVTKPVPHQKRYTSMPAVKIGRLGIHVDHQRKGLGTLVLDYVKAWFTKGNKTGCRFIIVDAYNNPDAIAFYRRNGFAFLTSDDKDPAAITKPSRTRIMYFDLITFRDGAD